MQLLKLNTLRKQLRQQRRAVTPNQQQQAQQAVLQRLIRLPKFQYAKKVGVYLDAFGEIHTQRIIEYCFVQGKQVYLPMICNMNQRLVWVQISLQQYRHAAFCPSPTRHARTKNKSRETYLAFRHGIDALIGLRYTRHSNWNGWWLL